MYRFFTNLSNRVRNEIVGIKQPLVDRRAGNCKTLFSQSFSNILSGEGVPSYVNLTHQGNNRNLTDGLFQGDASEDQRCFFQLLFQVGEGLLAGANGFFSHLHRVVYLIL